MSQIVEALERSNTSPEKSSPHKSELLIPDSYLKTLRLRAERLRLEALHFVFGEPTPVPETNPIKTYLSQRLEAEQRRLGHKDLLPLSSASIAEQGLKLGKLLSGMDGKNAEMITEQINSLLPGWNEGKKDKDASSETQMVEIFDLSLRLGLKNKE